MSEAGRYRYYLTEDDSIEREVVKAQFVAAERAAGFTNTMGQPDEPATAGFSGRFGDAEISGRMVYVAPGCVWLVCDHPESLGPGLRGHCSHASCPNYMESCPACATPLVQRW